MTSQNPSSGVVTNGPVQSILSTRLEKYIARALDKTPAQGWCENVYGVRYFPDTGIPQPRAHAVNMQLRGGATLDILGYTFALDDSAVRAHERACAEFIDAVRERFESGVLTREQWLRERVGQWVFEPEQEPQPPEAPVNMQLRGGVKRPSVVDTFHPGRKVQTAESLQNPSSGVV